VGCLFVLRIALAIEICLQESSIGWRQ
jgi:hypothetical protein